MLPDRNAVTMTAPFMRAYTELLVRTCHKRGAHAIGGMAAFIPSPPRRRGQQGRASRRSRPTRTARPTTASTAPGSPTRTWCRSPRPRSTRCSASGRTRRTACVRTSRVAAARPDRRRLAGRRGRTYAGLRNAVQVGIRYIEAWLRGLGAVAIFNLMEDAATAEISRSQIWQWINARRRLRERRAGHARTWSATIAAEELAAHPGGDRRGGLRGGPLAAGPRPAADRSRWTRTTPTSSPCRRYEQLD